MKDRANVQAVVEQGQKAGNGNVDDKVKVLKREDPPRAPEETVRISGWGPNVLYTVDI